MYQKPAETSTILSYKLPKEAKICVSEGEMVSEGNVLAEALISKDSMRFPIASLLSISPQKAVFTLTKRPGEKVVKGDLVCLKKSFFGLFKKRFFSPIDGEIDLVDNETGDLIIKLPRESYPFKTDVSGKIIEVNNFHVGVEFKAIEISGETNYMGKKVGKLKTRELSEEGNPLSSLNEGVKDRILAIYDSFGSDFLYKAAALGVAAVICGEAERDVASGVFSEKKLKVLAKEVVITLPVFILPSEEGRIKKELWEVLARHDGKTVIIDGDSKKLYLPV